MMMRLLMAAALLATVLFTGCGGPDPRRAVEEEAALNRLLDAYENLLKTHGEAVAAAADAEALQEAKAGLVRAVEDWSRDWGLQLQQTGNLTQAQMDQLRLRALDLQEKAKSILATELPEAEDEPEAAPEPEAGDKPEA